ncbi:MAG TPA: Ig-like domain repeat protein [Nocardioides sp.]|uniref:Ig-like domain repeat protein n=1 Tax=Nocardioides sp. TaxID=35761 RepID=UPI002C5C68BA|nr:Ig-like domain repeat protein [Nocardioides sp.]HTW16841.1 Ig-like domain repeat protein [Nocardioides sp.]
MFRSRAVPLLLALVLALAGTGAVVSAPTAQAAPPETPSGLSPGGGAVVDGSVDLGWDRVPGAASYDVQVAATSDFAAPLESVTGTVNLRYVPKVQLPEGEVWWRVRSVAGAERSPWSSAAFGYEAQPAPDPVRPAAGTVIQPPVDTPRFAWEPVAGATSYTVQVSPDPEFTDPALIITSTQRTTAAVLTGYQVAGTYHWRVRATLGTGYATRWSTVRDYLVRGLPAARLTAPADSFATPVRDVVLDWEPVPGAVTYEVQVSTDDGFLSVAHSVTGVVGTNYAPPTLDNDEYYWRVRPVDASNNKAPWPAEPWRFRRAWADQPTLVYPRGANEPGIPLFYEWTAIERASKYTLYLYDDDGGQPVCSAETVHTTLANACKPTAAGRYSWLVRATDDGAGKTPVTDILAQEPATFDYSPPTMGADPATEPAAAISGTAAYGVGGVEREVCTTALPGTCVDLRQTPVLTWPAVPGASSYRLILSRDRELTNVVETFTVSSTMWTPVKTLPDSQAGSAYFWVVDPCFGACPGLVRYAENSFAKKTVGPALQSPAPDAIVADDVTLTWGSALDAVRDPAAATGSSLTTPASTEARSYVVQTSVDPAFGAPIESVTVDERTFTSRTVTYPEGPVYWRVRAMDGSNNPTVWSETRRFVKRSPVPNLTGPADGTGLGVDYALSWEPLAFAAGYEVEVYAGPTKVDGPTSWKHVSWAPSDPYPVSEDYTWRVRRVDAKGRRGAWSEQRSFRIDPVVPSTVAPSEGAVVAPGTAYFSWEPDVRATSYRFERRKKDSTSLTENATTRAASWAPTAALAAGSWQWRVVLLDNRGSALGAAPWRSFTVVDPPAEVTRVSISGSGRVGSDLRVGAPTFDPVVDRIDYQWYRGTAKIADATEETYTVVQTDLGKQLTVRATGTLTGYKPAVSTSAPLVAVSGDALVGTPPTVTGNAVVGSTLAAASGTWPAGARVTRQWLRDGVPIPRATSSTYRLVAADAGRSVAVAETATATGRTPGTARSASVAVAKLASATTVKLTASRTTVKKRVSATVRITAAGLAAPGGTVTLYDRKRKLATIRLGARATATVRLPKLAVGRHTIKAVYSGAAQTRPSTSRAVKLVVRKR